MLYTEFLKAHTGCPFCVIDPTSIIKQNAYAALVYPVAPYIQNHLLVIPKRHVLDYADFTREERNATDILIVDGIKAIEKLGLMDYSIMLRSGDNERIGKSVSHLHFHVIPTVQLVSLGFKSDARMVISPEEMGEMVRRIKEVV
jgi:diadenosine tetraphosphate (Ap4A) HIT family hydrolase